MKKLTLYILMVLIFTCSCGINNKKLSTDTSTIINNQSDETLSQQKYQQTNQEKSLNKEGNQLNKNTEEPLEEIHPIDKNERDCIAKNMTTTGMSECSYKAMNEWFMEIDKYISLLKSVTTEEDYNKILNAQSKWKEYQEAEFKAVSIIMNKQGTIYQNFLAGEECGLVKKRALDLKFLYENLALD